MTWLFDKEKEAHERGLIDFFLYQASHVIDKVGPELRAINSCYRPVKIDPYFHLSDFPFVEDRSDETFRFARISRCDPAKFHPAQLWIYETMVAPVLKSGIMLGVDSKIREKIGPEPDWIQAYPAEEVSPQSAYERSHCLIQASETYENRPRNAFEAMASGCLLIVDDRGGWKELVEHRETGFLCQDPRDFDYSASRAVYEPDERKRMINNAREWLDARCSLETVCQQWQAFFKSLATVKQLIITQQAKWKK